MMSTPSKLTIDVLMQYLSAFSQDVRLNVWHLSILVAILQLGYRQGQDRIIRVSRRRIMALSHVNTLPTYHKYFNELQYFGYIKYSPSYHPAYRSEIELNERDCLKI